MTQTAVQLAQLNSLYIEKAQKAYTLEDENH